MLTQSALSLEYVRVRVEAQAGGESVDVTTMDVDFAFVLVTDGAPESGDWVGGSWDTGEVRGEPRYWARCLVGPGGAVELQPGVYGVWIRITGETEIPVRRSGLFKII